MVVLMYLDVSPDPLDRTLTQLMVDSRNYIEVVGYTGEFCIGVHRFFRA